MDFNKLLFLASISFSFALSATPVLGQSTTSSGYPYETTIDCDTKPVLTSAAVAEIAEYAKFKKLRGGSWKIQFAPGDPGPTTPFADACIWYVQTVPSKDEAAHASVVGTAFMLIEDQTKKYWLPILDLRTRTWIIPTIVDLPRAP